jgi:CheY-like chemotaxis protein
MCDLYLPVLDGFELIRRAREKHPKGTLPIVAFSAGGAEAGRRALSLGADIFLDKPLRLTKVFDTICDLLRLGDFPSAPASGPGGPPAP